MPFTLAHIAAVLPVARHPLCVAALVAGSVAPDMPYYARALPVAVTADSWYEPFMNATTTHSLPGAVTVAGPYALLLTLSWWIAKRPLSQLTEVRRGPTGRRLVGTPLGSRVRVLAVSAVWVALSVLIGIATHLVWDSFTHADGYVVTHVSALRDPATDSLTWARLLQHLSTAFGLGMLAIVVFRRRDDVALRPRSVAAVITVAVAGVVCGALLAWQRAARQPGGAQPEVLLRQAAEVAGLVVVGVLALYVVGWWIRRALSSGSRSAASPPAAV